MELTLELLGIRRCHGLPVNSPAREVASLDRVPHVGDTEIGVFTRDFDRFCLSVVPDTLI